MRARAKAFSLAWFAAVLATGSVAAPPLVAERVTLSAAGEPVKITVYPDTYHGFDGPPTQRWLRLEVPNGVHPGQGVTVAPNPDARADAYIRLEAYLRAQLAERFDDGSSVQQSAHRAAHPR